MNAKRTQLITVILDAVATGLWVALICEDLYDLRHNASPDESLPLHILGAMMCLVAMVLNLIRYQKGKAN